MVGAEKARCILVKGYFPPMSGLRMLDIGCGTAEILQHLPEDMAYFGFDASEDYITKAEKRFGQRGTFRTELVSTTTLETMEPFDLILAFGLLHHLDNTEADALFRLAAGALKPVGKLITIDPVYADGQSAQARWIISKDRGQNIRSPEAYSNLAAMHFEHVNTTVCHNMLYIPYSHLILECRSTEHNTG